MRSVAPIVRRLATLAVAIAWLAVCSSCANAQRRQAAAPHDLDCAALTKADFAGTRDASFIVVSAAVERDGAQVPFCAITGYVAPEIGFAMRLPLADWNHGFVLIGSGGWATEARVDLCAEPLRMGYACVAGDSGHRQPGGLWLQGNAQAKIDWGYRATHVKTLAARALLQAFYGSSATSSLMLGCSTGGYQGLVEAQRFPWDFSGIVAVAPDIDEGDLNLRTVWAARHFVGDDGRPLFDAASLGVLHRAALAACDTNDGLRDGIIGDPTACRFDPMAAACRGAAGKSCLSNRQAVAASLIYAGPTNSTGQRLSTPGPFPGSELGWPDFLDDVVFSDMLFRHALADSPRDGVTANRFDFDEDAKRLGLLGTFVSSNPDLRRFAEAGGRLMIVQGGNDATEQGYAAIDYYRMVERVAGGRQATRGFARLFVVAGMDHCSGGDGAYAIDYLAAMRRWVDAGEAPDKLIGAHVADGDPAARAVRASLTAPSAGATVAFTRPVYPWPLYARYDGHGDVNDARSFRPAESRAPSDGR